uniref:Uncharacterized protein n=1 Tax=Sphaerodactylus townsendi TaxID=933632 RepID=A0ACB8EE14_9SAUR
MDCFGMKRKQAILQFVKRRSKRVGLGYYPWRINRGPWLQKLKKRNICMRNQRDAPPPGSSGLPHSLFGLGSSGCRMWECPIWRLQPVSASSDPDRTGQAAL